MARQAMILDLRTGAMMKLGQSRTAVIIGLSKNDELLCATGEELEPPEIVLELCRVKYKADGHWLIPTPNLTTTVNDNVIRGHVLVKNGAVIGVGNRFMRYRLSSLPGCNTATQYCTGSIPLGAMTNFENISTSTMKLLTASTTFDPAAVYASMRSLSNKTSAYPDDGSISGPDPELLQFLQTNDGLAHMTAAIVSQHVFMHTSLKLSAAEIDCLFLSFEHVTAWEDICFNTFLCEYEQLFAVKEESTQNNGSHLLDLPGASCIHSPVIHLLTSLLKVTLDPMKYNILWLRMLAVLTKCSKSLTPLIEYKTSGAVLGCMAAKADVAEIQEHGCYILAEIANYRPPCGEKGPLREGALQIVLDVLRTHKSVSKVRKNAIRFLGNITQTYARLAMDVVNTLKFVTLEEQRDALVEVMRMLNFVEEEAVPMLPDLLHCCRDERSHAQIKKIMSYFHDNAGDTKTGDVNGADPVQEQEVDLQVTEHFDQTQEFSEATARMNSHSVLRDVKRSDKQRTVQLQKDTRENTPGYSNKDILSNDVTDSSSTATSPSSNKGNSEGGRQNVGGGGPHGKSKPGMLAFIVRTSKKDKENCTPRTVSEDSSSVNGLSPNNPLRQSIINGVEFFSDEEDNSLSENNIKHTKNKNPSIDQQSIKSANKKISDCDKLSDLGKGSESSTIPPSCIYLECMQPQKEKIFVSEAALDAGSPLTANRNTYLLDVSRKKRTSLFDKLAKKSSRPKKRCSVLCTEYTQKPKLIESVQLTKSSLLYDCFERPHDYSRNTADVKSMSNKEISTAKRPDSHREIHYPDTIATADPVSPQLLMSSVDNGKSLELGVNVFRYVNIFCNMSKRKKFKDTASIASSMDSTEHKKLKAVAGPETVIEFVKRTRKLFREGRGRYDIAEAAIHASFNHKDVSGMSYSPLSFEEHGYD